MHYIIGFLIIGTTKGRIVSYWYSDKSPLLGLLAKVAFTHNGRPGVIGLHVQVDIPGYRGHGDVVVEEFYSLTNLGEAINPYVVRAGMLALDNAMWDIATGFYRAFPNSEGKDEMPASITVDIIGQLL